MPRSLLPPMGVRLSSGTTLRQRNKQHIQLPDRRFDVPGAFGLRGEEKVVAGGDGHFPSFSHEGAFSRKAAGDSFLSAFVAGYEFACRVGALLEPAHYANGFHATATIGSLGSQWPALICCDWMPNKQRTLSAQPLHRRPA